MGYFNNKSMNQKDVDQSLDESDDKFAFNENPHKIPYPIHVYLFFTTFFWVLLLNIAYVNLRDWSGRFIVFTLLFTLLSLLGFWLVSRGYRELVLVQLAIIGVLSLSIEPDLGIFVFMLIVFNILITGITYITPEAVRYYNLKDPSTLEYKLVFYLYSIVWAVFNSLFVEI